MNSLLKLKNVTKRFSSVTLFENVNIDIHQKGLYGLIGASGSGKSTLLLMIGLIDEEYEGDIFFKNINYKEIKNKEEYIFNHIGFVFQNPVLFSDLTLYENLSLTNDVDDKKINEFLLKMGLLAKKKTLAKNLSGGERVRLSIIRSLLNNPDILILDEPTSALDEYNSSLIMSFLKEEANNRAILIVSHNVKLLEKNVQYLYVLKNRKIELISNKQNRTYLEKEKKKKSNYLSFSFIYKYILSNIKRKKFKSFFHIFSLFISMFVVGFSLVLTNDVSSMIIESINALTENNEIIMKYKNDIVPKIEEVSINEDEANDILSNSSYFYDYGYIYSSSFEKQFCDNNYMELVNGDLSFYDVGIRKISETVLLDDIDNSYKFYPKRPYNMEKDEIVLGLKKSDIKKICKSLSLNDLDEDSLSLYMNSNEIIFKFKFTNLSWNYDIEIPFKLKAFFITSDELLISHIDKDFTSYVFEDVMKLPTSDNLSIVDLYPWTIKKQIYIKANELDIENAIKEYLTSFYYENYDLKVLKGNINSSLFSSSFHKGKFLVSYASKGKLSYELINKTLNNKNVDNIFPLGPFYQVVEGALISGFTNSIFISSSKDDLEKVGYYFNDINENVDTIDLTKFDLGDVSYGNLITSALKKGIKLSSSIKGDIYGRKPKNIDEVMISSGLCNKLFDSYENAINKKLYMIINNYNYEDGNTFSHTYLTISGIYEDNNERIYQDAYWYPTFLVSRMDYPLENVQINKFLINSSSSIEELNTIDERIMFVDPLIMMNESVNNMINMINIVLSVFMVLLIISSLGISQISMQTSMMESSKEIGLLKSIGINIKSTLLLYFINNIFNFVFAYFLASSTLFFVSKIVSTYFFSLPLTISVNIIPYVSMLLLGLIIVLPFCLIYTLIPVLSKTVTLIKRYY